MPHKKTNPKCKLHSIINVRDFNFFFNSAKTKGVRRGYMGHLITISQVLLQTASTDAVVDKILNETPEWLEYVKGPLAQTRAIQATRLADYVSSGKFIYSFAFFFVCVCIFF